MKLNLLDAVSKIVQFRGVREEALKAYSLYAAQADDEANEEDGPFLKPLVGLHKGLARSCLALLLILTAAPCAAKVYADPVQVLKEQFAKGQTFKKENIIFTRQQVAAASQLCHCKITDKVVTFISARDSQKKLLGGGVLLTQKVRTKFQALLITISTQQKIKDIEVVAFYEPEQYKPGQAWLDKFSDKGLPKLTSSPDPIGSITGATLSAARTKEMAKQALALWQVHLKGSEAKK